MARARSEPPDWLFDPGRRRPLTRDALVAAGLLDCDDLCAGCAAGLAVPGPEGTYWRLARLIVASGEWVTALEHAAPPADWLAYSRWTARTPFTDPRPIAALITTLAGNRQWATCAAAARAARDQLRHRAEAAWELARQSAGPPGLRAVAACACALTRAEPETRAESRSIAAITGQAGSHDDNLRPWAIASGAWLDAIARDGNPAAGKHALRDALLAAYAGAPVRDLALLPAMATSQPDDEYSSAAEWAQADYRAVLHLVADAWSDRLDADLAMMLDPPSGLWQLLLVLGWPLTDDADEDLAYLASYPEHARIRDPGCCGVACGRRHDSWAVVLHVPAFAVTHALTHDSAHLDVIPGPQLPPGTQPSPEQIQELLSHAHDNS